MGLEVILTWRDVGWLTSAVATIIGLVWLLRAVPRSTLRDAFAVFLAITLVNLFLYPVLWHIDGHYYWMAESADNLVALAGAYFLTVWVVAGRGTRPSRWLPLPFVTAAVAIEILYFTQPGWRYEVDSKGMVLRIGPMFAIENVFEIALGVTIACLFLRAAVRRDSMPLALAAYGFLWPFVLGLDDIVWYVMHGTERVTSSGVQRALELLIDTSHATAALFLIGAVAFIGIRGERNRTKNVVLASFAGLAMLSLALGTIHAITEAEAWARAPVVLAGLTILMLPIFGTLHFVSQANVGHESRVWKAVRKGSLPALMLATFFVVSETAQTFLSGSLGPTVGILATAPLVLAISPIQRLGDRFGHAIVPGPTTPVAQAAFAGKEAVYERQVRFAWTDGRIAGKERSRLIALRKDLGIDAERAESIEAAVVADAEKSY